MPREKHGPGERPRIRTLLVDDSSDFRTSVAHYLSSDTGCELVGQAASGSEGIESVALLRPDLVLIDLHMPEMDGLEVTRTLKSAPSPPRVVVLTMSTAPVYREAAAAAGADGFLDKAEFGSRLGPLVDELFPSPPGPSGRRSS